MGNLGIGGTLDMSYNCLRSLPDLSNLEADKVNLARNELPETSPLGTFQLKKAKTMCYVWH